MQVSPYNRLIVPLLGMHRSGTSLAARAFCEAGLPMGDRLLLSPTPDNSDGYWEDGDIVAVQDRLTDSLLASCGVTSQYSHEACADFPANWVESEPGLSAFDALRQILEQRFPANAVFGFKDPRTVRLLPLWRKLAQHFGAGLVTVLLTRSPAEVAASLYSRQAIPPPVGEALWLRAMSDVMTDAGDALRLRIPYADWRDAEAVGERIRQFVSDLGLQPQSSPAPFRPQLRHHSGLRSPIGAINGISDAIDAGEITEDVARRIRRLVDDSGGWRGLPVAIAPGYRIDGAASELALIFPPTPHDHDPPIPELLTPHAAARGSLLAGNEWSLNGWGGFRLHANPATPAATLIWRGVPAPEAGAFTLALAPSPNSGTPLAVQVSLQTSDGAPLTDQLIPLSRLGDPVTVTVAFANSERRTIDLRIVLHPLTDAPPHNAWVLLTRPTLRAN